MPQKLIADMPRYLRWLLMLVVAASIAATYHQGVDRKINTRITYGFEHDYWSMSVAMSRLNYGLHEGYIGYRDVVNVMRESLAPKGLQDPSTLDNLKNPHAIEEAFARARSIDPSTLPDHKRIDGHFVSIYGEDVGLADLYTLAFSVFGYHADSMYKMYFLIFALSATLLMAAYAQSTKPLALLALITLTFGAFFFSTIFDDRGMPSVNSNRFGSTLGAIPILHVLCSFYQREKPDRKQLLLLAGQALIFAFALSIRNTAKWQLLLCLMVAALALLPIVRQYGATYLARNWRTFAWPRYVVFLVVFLAVLMGYKAIQRTQLNDLYFTDCALPYHVTWHSMIIGLSHHPKWPEYNDFSSGTGGDAIPWHAFERYMNERGEPFTCPETGGLHKVRLHEKVMRELYLKFAWKNPDYMWDLHMDYKIPSLIELLRIMLASVEPWFLKTCLAASAFAGGVAAILHRGRRRVPWSMLGIAAVGFLLACLPNVAAYPNKIMADVMWMAIINACLWAGVLVYRLLPLKKAA